MKRPKDTIEIRGKQGIYDAFDAVNVSTALNGPSDARFKLGDDGAWDRLEKYVRPGYEYDVLLNGNPLLRGRVEIGDAAGSTQGGVDFDIAVRTKLSDARYSSADVKLKVSNVTLKQFILALFEPLGFREADFVFAAATNRDLLTGKSIGGAKIDLDPIQLSAAKVQPPESIMQCAARHLERHGLMIWEAVDGKICVGFPDDKQRSLYRLICHRPDRGANNAMDFRRIRDWSEVSNEMNVLGFSPGKDFTKVPIFAQVIDQDVADVFADTGHFGRRVSLPMDRAKDTDAALRQAKRELAVRAKRKDAWEFMVDGWSYWDGDALIPWTFNAVADVEVDVAGGPAGPYMIWRVSYSWTSDTGSSASMALVAPGIWTLS